MAGETFIAGEQDDGHVRNVEQQRGQVECASVRDDNLSRMTRLPGRRQRPRAKGLRKSGACLSRRHRARLGRLRQCCRPSTGRTPGKSRYAPGVGRRRRTGLRSASNSTRSQWRVYAARRRIDRTRSTTARCERTRPHGSCFWRSVGIVRSRGGTQSFAEHIASILQPYGGTVFTVHRSFSHQGEMI